MTGNVQEDPRFPSDSRYGMKDAGRWIAPKRYEAFIDRVFTAQHRPEDRTHVESL